MRRSIGSLIAVWTLPFAPNCAEAQQPVVIKPGQTVEEACRGRAAELTCDIASNPRRGATATGVGLAIISADNLQGEVTIKDYDIIIRSMKEQARIGAVGDNLIGELAQRGISRVRFQEHNGTIVRDQQGNPIIANDRVQGLAANIVGTALQNPTPRNIEMGQGIRPLAITKPRVCVAAFADINMRLQLNTGTEGQPMSVTNDVVRQVVTNDRAAVSDTDLENRVKGHMAKSPFGKSGMSVSSDKKAAHGDVDHGG